LITNEQLCRLRGLRDALPGLIANIDSECPEWDAIIVAAEWECGVDCTEPYRVTSGIFSPNSLIVGCVLNFDRAESLVESEMQNPDELISSLCRRHDEINLFCAVQKMAHNREMSLLFSSMSTIKDAFLRLSDHHAPFEYQWSERHGNLLKFFRGEGNLAMEMASDPSGRVMYRSWNEDGGMNCEMKLNCGMRSDIIEWAKIYFNHCVVHEWNNKVL